MSKEFAASSAALPVPLLEMPSGAGADSAGPDNFVPVGAVAAQVEEPPVVAAPALVPTPSMAERAHRLGLHRVDSSGSYALDTALARSRLSSGLDSDTCYAADAALPGTAGRSDGPAARGRAAGAAWPIAHDSRDEWAARAEGGLAAQRLLEALVARDPELSTEPGREGARAALRYRDAVLAIIPPEEVMTGSVHEVMGQGHFGKTVSAVVDGASVVVKYSTMPIGPHSAGSLAVLKEAFVQDRAARVVRGGMVARVHGVVLRGPMAPGFVMERCSGGTLDSACFAGGVLEIRMRLRLALKVCEAVSDLHSAGMVHRDIKPDNIMLTGPIDDPGTCVRLIDFGHANLLRDGESASSLQYRTILTEVFRTFRPPENVTRDGEYSFLGDRFALGLTLFEVVAGLRVYTPEGERGLARFRRARERQPDTVRLAEAELAKLKYDHEHDIARVALAAGWNDVPTSTGVTDVIEALLHPIPERRANLSQVGGELKRHLAMLDREAEAARVAEAAEQAKLQLRQAAQADAWLRCCRFVSRSSEAYLVGGLAVALLAALLGPWLLAIGSGDLPLLDLRFGGECGSAVISLSPWGCACSVDQPGAAGLDGRKCGVMQCDCVDGAEGVGAAATGLVAAAAVLCVALVLAAAVRAVSRGFTSFVEESDSRCHLGGFPSVVRPRDVRGGTFRLRWSSLASLAVLAPLLVWAIAVQSIAMSRLDDAARAVAGPSAGAVLGSGGQAVAVACWMALAIAVYGGAEAVLASAETSSRWAACGPLARLAIALAERRRVAALPQTTSNPMATTGQLRAMVLSASGGGTTHGQAGSGDIRSRRTGGGGSASFSSSSPPSGTTTIVSPLPKAADGKAAVEVELTAMGSPGRRDAAFTRPGKETPAGPGHGGWGAEGAKAAPGDDARHGGAAGAHAGDPKGSMTAGGWAGALLARPRETEREELVRSVGDAGDTAGRRLAVSAAVWAVALCAAAAGAGDPAAAAILAPLAALCCAVLFAVLLAWHPVTARLVAGLTGDDPEDTLPPAKRACESSRARVHRVCSPLRPLRVLVLEALSAAALALCACAAAAAVLRATLPSIALAAAAALLQAGHASLAAKPSTASRAAACVGGLVQALAFVLVPVACVAAAPPAARSPAAAAALDVPWAAGVALAATTATVLAVALVSPHQRRWAVLGLPGAVLAGYVGGSAAAAQALVAAIALLVAAGLVVAALTAASAREGLPPLGRLALALATAAVVAVATGLRVAGTDAPAPGSPPCLSYAASCSPEVGGRADASPSLVIGMGPASDLALVWVGTCARGYDTSGDAPVGRPECLVPGLPSTLDVAGAVGLSSDAFAFAALDGALSSCSLSARRCSRPVCPPGAECGAPVAANFSALGGPLLASWNYTATEHLVVSLVTPGFSGAAAFRTGPGWVVPVRSFRTTTRLRGLVSIGGGRFAAIAACEVLLVLSPLEATAAELIAVPGSGCLLGVWRRGERDLSVLTQAGAVVIVTPGFGVRGKVSERPVLGLPQPLPRVDVVLAAPDARCAAVLALEDESTGESQSLVVSSPLLRDSTAIDLGGATPWSMSMTRPDHFVAVSSPPRDRLVCTITPSGRGPA